MSPIINVAETGSTNADLLAMARDGADEGVWFYADQQNAGRGRQGRIWASPAGNLYASALIRLRRTDPVAATLALVAGVATIEAVQSYVLAAPLHLKWPNDVMAGSAKLAGLLLEREGDAVVIGIGANLVSHPALPDRQTTSLVALGAPVILPRQAVEDLARHLTQWLGIWRTAGVGAIIAAWQAKAHPYGTTLAVDAGLGTRTVGTFAGLDSTGALRLCLADGTISVIHAGDVFLV